MDKRFKLTIINAAGSLGSAFFLMAACILMILPPDRNFYNINLIDLSELFYMLPGFLAGAGVLFFLQRRADVATLSLNAALAWLIFTFVFALKAPVVSLALGGFIIAIPAAYMVLAVVSGSKETQTSRFVKIWNYGISGLALCLFLITFCWIFIKGAQEYVPLSAINIAKISDDPLYNEEYLGVWKVGLYIFAGALALYGALALIPALNLKDKRPVRIAALVFPGLLLVAQVTIFSLFMVYRVKSMIASTYDFGIFTQMFYNMKDMQGMVTTLERSVVMSHLLVHFSPIYYLMLPAFVLFPYPDTLQVLQVLVASSSVIPLYLIMKQFKTGTLMRMLFLIMCIASPAIISSSMYDIHENCFLAPLLLFVIYFGLKRQTLPLFLFGALTLMVKEDSGLYLMFIGLYFAVYELVKDVDGKTKIKNAIHGVILAVAAIGYFLIVTNHLETAGDGAMFWRYNNINGYTDKGLLGIFLSVFQDPSYFFATFFSPSKVATLLIMLGSVGFLPLILRDRTAYLLAAPVLIMNFASNYVYQHQLGFQYFYGTGALLLYMAVLAEKEYRERPLFPKLFARITPTHVLGIFGVAIAFTFGVKYIVGSGLGWRIYWENPGRFDAMKATLGAIPKDKKVVATGFLTPQIADRFYLYDYDYYNILYAEEQLDYIIIDMRISETNLTKIRNRCHQAGYVESPLTTEYILIYVPGS